MEESISVAGIDCYYVPRKIDSRDEVLNEIYNAKYENAYKIEVLREELGGFYPNDFLVSKFGLEFSGANTIFAVSKAHFTKVTGMIYPEQGGLLAFSDMRQIYEIKDVDTRDPWISNGKMFYWKLSCLPFDRDSEHTLSDSILEHIDGSTSEFIEDLLESNDIYDPIFFTADNDCVFVSSTHHFVDEDMRDDFFMPITADREDIDASDDTVYASSDAKINNGMGSMQIMNQTFTDNKNVHFVRDSAQYNVRDNFGFN